MKKQNGFTLIELMIVVAVIGVLSAVAVPQYQKYVAKAEVATALATITALKTTVETHAITNGEFPESDAAGITIPNMESGDITLFKGTNSAGEIQFKFSGGVNDLKDKNIYLARTKDGKWSCKNDGIEESLLSKSCKASAAVGTTN